MNVLKMVYSKRYRIKKYLDWFINNKSINSKKIIALLLKNEGIGIEATTQIGKGLIMEHPYGIVLGAYTIINENVTIFQNVTIGQKDGKYPTIGSNCIIYPNSVVFGGVTIGDHCVVGAGSVVNKSFPSYSIVAGNPAKEISND